MILKFIISLVNSVSFHIIGYLSLKFTKDSTHPTTGCIFLFHATKPITHSDHTNSRTMVIIIGSFYIGESLVHTLGDHHFKQKSTIHKYRATEMI